MNDTHTHAEDHFLRYDTWKEGGDPIRAELFGHLLIIGQDVVKHYRSDFFRDAQWILENVNGPMTFYYAVRDCGTSIGTDRELVAYIAHDALYRVELFDRDAGKPAEWSHSWHTTIQEVTA